MLQQIARDELKRIEDGEETAGETKSGPVTASSLRAATTDESAPEVNLGKLTAPPLNIPVVGGHQEEPTARRLDGKKFKSGRAITRSLNVIIDVSFSHIKAIPRVAGRRDIKFDEMTHWEFIEGELLIIDDPLTPEIEKKLHYSHLQEVVPYASMFPWRAIIHYNGAFLEE